MTRPCVFVDDGCPVHHCIACGLVKVDHDAEPLPTEGGRC